MIMGQMRFQLQAMMEDKMYMYSKQEMKHSTKLSYDNGTDENFSFKL